MDHCETDTMTPGSEVGVPLAESEAPYTVAYEEPPEDTLFHHPQFQLSLSSGQSLMGGVCDSLQHVNAADDQRMPQLVAKSAQLRDLRCSSSKAIMLVGDSGTGKCSLHDTCERRNTDQNAGKSSVANGLLDVSGLAPTVSQPKLIENIQVMSCSC